MRPLWVVGIALVVSGCCVFPEPWEVRPADQGCPITGPPSGECALSPTVLCTYSRATPCSDAPPEFDRCACRSGQWQCHLDRDGGRQQFVIDASAGG